MLSVVLYCRTAEESVYAGRCMATQMLGSHLASASYIKASNHIGRSDPRLLCPYLLTATAWCLPASAQAVQQMTERSSLGTSHITTDDHAMQRYLTVRNSHQLGALRDRLFANRTNCRV